MKRVYITDGTKMPLRGRAILVYRISNTKSIEMKNVTDVSV